MVAFGGEQQELADHERHNILAILKRPSAQKDADKSA
jgi:hypothetical protein